MSERSNWNIFTQSGVNWIADGTIYRPNSDLSLDLISTQSRIKLSNGSNAFITPETKYTKEILTFQWYEILNSDSFKAKIENYVINQTYLKITDHLSNDYIGRFISVKRVWITGVAPDVFDLEAIFEQME